MYFTENRATVLGCGIQCSLVKEKIKKSKSQSMIIIPLLHLPTSYPHPSHATLFVNLGLDLSPIYFLQFFQLLPEIRASITKCYTKTKFFIIIIYLYSFISSCPICQTKCEQCCH